MCTTLSMSGTREECESKISEYKSRYNVTNVELYRASRDILGREIWSVSITYEEKK